MSDIAAHWCAMLRLPPLLLWMSFSLPAAGTVFLLVMPWCVWLMFGSLPFAWGLVVLLYCFFGLRDVYRLANDRLYVGTVRRHAVVARGVVLLLDSAAVMYFINSSWPRDLSAWWSIVLYFLPTVPVVIVSLVLERVFDGVYPAARGRVDPPAMAGRRPMPRR